MTFSGEIFFSFKSAWIFACAFQLSRKTFSCIVFWLKCSCSALLCSLRTLQYFVFVFLRNKVQTRHKKYRGMLSYLSEKHMKKFRHFWRKKNFTWKSHLRPSCTKPFNYLIFNSKEIIVYIFMYSVVCKAKWKSSQGAVYKKVRSVLSLVREGFSGIEIFLDCLPVSSDRQNIFSLLSTNIQILLSRV